MKRLLAMTALSLIALAPLLLAVDASARVGGGGSGGSRGSRSYTAPAQPSPSRQVAPSTPVAPSSPIQQPMPQRSGWGGMLGGALGGLLLGGLIGSMFGGFGHGGFGGGVGLLEIAVIGALVYFGYRMMKSRQPAPAGPAEYAGMGGYGDDRGRYASSSSYGGPATLEMPAPPSDLDRGLGHVRQLDSGFDPARFAEVASDVFFKLQAAWMARDMGSVADLLTPEMQDLLQKDCDRLRADRRINRLENISIRTAELTEAWQERGQDYVTVHFLASVLDYTTDESGAKVLDGSRTEPVKFEEYWTFVRPAGPNSWRLSAIQQP